MPPIFGPKQIQNYAQEANQIPGIPQQEQDESGSGTPSVTPPPPRGLPFGYKAGMVGANLLDAISTRKALESTGDNREGNPFFGSIAKSTPGLIAAKSGIGLLESYAYDKLAKTHPNLARALSIGSIAAPTIAGISNISKIK